MSQPFLHQKVTTGAAVAPARFTAPVYWVVDVNARVVHVMSDPQDGVYSRREVVRFDEPLAIPGSDAAIILA